MADLPLEQGWQLARAAPGSITDPAELAGAPLAWDSAQVPGTVAAALHRDLHAPGPYDDSDWWYRSEFAAAPAADGQRLQLRCDGLATLCRVWLNGTLILTSRNMFRRHVVDVTALVRQTNSLVMVFESLSAAAGQRLPRPRWKTALVEQQNLRWFRTTLLGRIPGWTPPITPVGPWRAITLERVERFLVHSSRIVTATHGSRGVVRFEARVALLGRAAVAGARLRVGSQVADLTVTAGGDVADPTLTLLQGELTLAAAPLWWPHTHGDPQRVPVSAELLVDCEWLTVGTALVGFRELTVDQRDGGLRLAVNGVPVFCRGACWTTADILSLQGDAATLRPILAMARDAGLNMIRVGGTMVYESDAFYALCDELGILVWQDFMFANMDYPVADAAFHDEILAEARDQLDRLQGYACIAAWCGGSEVAQQAAMLGRPPADWTNEFFSTTLPALCAALPTGAAYFPSSPWGGALPFHVGTGISHYYGVGAYKRPLSDVKHAGVRFTTECLGFSNVPDSETVALLSGGRTLPPHHPRWKARVPRDSGPGWDFEDIRDHYFRVLYGIDPVELRSVDVERYYALSRVVTGELMGRVFSEWRRPDNPCDGGLVWFLRDLWPGAGWGIIDSTGRPKAAYWQLRRAWAPRTVRLVDAGLDGLNILLLNDSAEPIGGEVQLARYHQGRLAADVVRTAVKVPARGAVTLQADALLGHFADLGWAYRFGPPTAEVIAVRWVSGEDHHLIGEDCHFPCGLSLPLQHDVAAEVSAVRDADGSVRVRIASPVFLQAVSIACSGFSADDNYFHVSPDLPKQLVFRPTGSGTPERFKAEFEALNLAGVLTARVAPPSP